MLLSLGRMVLYGHPVNDPRAAALAALGPSRGAGVTATRFGVRAQSCRPISKLGLSIMRTRLYLDTLLAKWDFWLSLALFIVGILLILGELLILRSPGYVSAFGGAVVGTGLSNLITVVGSHSRDEELSQKLEGALPEGAFDTEEKRLHVLRRKYYYYHVTQENDTVKWHYSSLDMSKYSVGKLIGTVSISERHYRAEGFIKRDSLLLCFSSREPIDQELLGCHVFQDFANIYQEVFSGAVLEETFDSTKLVAACILSTKKLIEQLCDDDFAELDQASELSSLWHNTMKQAGYTLFPMPGQQHSEARV